MQEELAPLSADYLAGEPLAATLGGSERAIFALVNKRGGVTVEDGAGSETYRPDRRYRTVATVTDRRLVLAVGGADDGADRVVTIPLSEVTSVESEDGLLGGRLVVETAAEERWSMPCKGDLEPVVSYLSAARRAWSRAEGFLDEVDVRIETARSAADPESTLSMVEQARTALDRGCDRLSTFEMGEAVTENAGFPDRRDALRAVERRAHFDAAEAAHERANERHERGAFRQAAEAFRSAQEAYESALTTTGPEPADTEILDRLEVLSWEREDLARTPLADAAVAFSRARGQEDPVQRARSLETALERYRTLLGLSWGPEALFEGDGDAIRERITAIVADLVTARSDAVRRALTAADRFAARDREGAALAACDTAETHLDVAREIAVELAPEHVDALDALRAGIDEQRERIRAPDGPRSDTEPAVPAGGTESTAEESSAVTAEQEETADEPETTTGSSSTMEARIESLDQDELTRFVADAWAASGWQTTVFTASVDQYDVIATRQWPIELRVLIWVRARAQALDVAAVDRCAADRANDDRADIAALITGGEAPQAVRERADDHNVKLLERSDLARLVEREGTGELLDQQADY